MTDKQIIACKLPGDLFSSPENMEKEFTELAQRWHPDKMGGNSIVMAHVNSLHAQGREMVASGNWKSSNKRFFTLSNGRTVRISFLSENDFELGKWYLCESVCVYAFNTGSAINFKLPKFRFRNTSMTDEFTAYLPRIIDQYEVNNGKKLIVINREKDLVLLRDLLAWFGNAVPPKHVAWILSSLYNLCAFFKYNGIVHHSINLNTYFISPAKHKGVLLGGWWYHKGFDRRMKVVPKSTYDVMTLDTKKSKKATPITDLECVKLIGRQLLGSASGSTLYSNPDIPKPMIQFLRTISSENAYKEYEAWTNVLQESFGPKKFIEMDCNADEIYKKPS